MRFLQRLCEPLGCTIEKGWSMIDRRNAIAGAFAATAASRVSVAEDVPALLKRHTQALMDAITTGESTVWAKLLHPDAVLTDEGGAVTPRAKLLASMKPFPADISGRIRVLDFVAHVHGDTAIATYLSDEDESYYGANLHCQYRSTDTWRRANGHWQLIASQVLALRTDPPENRAAQSETVAIVGDYMLASNKRMTIASTPSGLTLTELDWPAKSLRREASDVWFVPGSPRYRYIVERAPGGTVTAIIQRREAWDLRWVRT